MSKNTLLILAFLISLAITACGATAPAQTPQPPATPTPADTATPTVTPLPATPSLKGWVEINTLRVVYECYGEGSPTVVVEPGLGDTPVTSNTWKAVVQGVYSTTRICIYNRKDFVTSADAARGLHELLSKIPVPGPYIIAAHSFGGYNARVFRALYPDEVAGMILVDTTMLLDETLKRLGPAFPTQSPDEAPAIATARPDFFNTDETGQPAGTYDMAASSEQVRQAGGFGDLPLIVIGSDMDPQVWISAYPWMDLETAKRMVDATNASRADLARLSTRGEFILANTSHHFISSHDPHTVIDAILRMVAEIR